MNDDMWAGLFMGILLMLAIMFFVHIYTNSQSVIGCSEKTGRTVTECTLIVDRQWDEWAKLNK